MPEAVTSPSLTLPVVLLPGTLCGAELWQGVRGLAGHRRFGPEVLRGTTLPQAAELALEGVPERFHLVGFSLGAILACEVLRRYPERVARLTLIAANPHAPREEQRVAWAEQEAWTRAGQFERVVSAVSPAGAHRERVQEMARRVGPATFLEQLALMRSRPDSRPDLTRYPGPLTLLVGRDDAVTPPALSEELRASRPHAQTTVTVVAGAGHYLPLDAPKAVVAALTAERSAAYA